MTDPASRATDSASGSGYISVTWTASDATSGVSSTELWCKKLKVTGEIDWVWTPVHLIQGGTSNIFYYRPTHGDGEYFFATRSVDKAGDWENPPSGNGDTSINYIASTNTNNPTGKESASAGCFIDTAAPD